MPRQGLLSRLAGLFTPRPARTSGPVPPIGRDDLAPATGARRTVEVPIEKADDVVIAYRPNRNGAPDAGEVVWTWVPYEENAEEGKDRPVLIIARAGGQRMYAVKLTSKSHDGDRDFLPLGTGPWDSRGRESWVDIDQLYSVHVHGIRREASALDRTRFAHVADALHRRYGWAEEA